MELTRLATMIDISRVIYGYIPLVNEIHIHLDPYSTVSSLARLCSIRHSRLWKEINPRDESSIFR